MMILGRLAIISFLLLSCGKKNNSADEPAPTPSVITSGGPGGGSSSGDDDEVTEEEAVPAVPETPRYLYAVSGGCYAGGLTTMTGSNVITEYNLSDGSLNRTLVDYNASSLGDAPVGLQRRADGKFYVTIENTAGRRVDLLDGSTGTYSTFITNAGLNGVLRDLRLLVDGSLLISKSAAIEKFSYNKARILQGGVNSFIQAPAGTCANSTTMMVASAELSSQKLVFAHAAATPNNQFGVINQSGYSVVGDCLASQTAPTTTALPTAIAVHSSGDVLVAYGSTTLTSNFIYSYRVSPTTGLITSPIAAFNNPASVYGPSAMVFDGNDLYVANGANTYNNVEKFTYNTTTQLLTRVGVDAFIQPTIVTRCISSLLIGD